MDTRYTSLHQNDEFGLTVSNLKYSATLAASTDTTLTVPSSSARYKAIMKSGAVTSGSDAAVWMAVGTTAEVPAGATFAKTDSEMITVHGILCREVKAGDVLHFFTAGTGIDISVIFYAIK